MRILPACHPNLLHHVRALAFPSNRSAGFRGHGFSVPTARSDSAAYQRIHQPYQSGCSSDLYCVLQAYSDRHSTAPADGCFSSISPAAGTGPMQKQSALIQFIYHATLIIN